MADQPLSSATHRRLGGLLSHQLPNGIWAHLCPIKSFTAAPCGAVVIYRISSRFRLLSRWQRQVAHTLLTRSPLTFIPEGNQSVRLACVKHAASVRPEPGSNSWVQSWLSYNFLFKGFLDVFNNDLIHIKNRFSKLFNYQGSCRCRLVTASLYYHKQVSLSTIFKKFFKKFFEEFLIVVFKVHLGGFRSPICRTASWQLAYSTTFRFFCKAFLQEKWNFF